MEGTNAYLRGLFLQLSFQRLLRFDTSVILEVKPTQDDTFLAFTVCPSFDAGYKESVLRSPRVERMKI